MLSALVLGSTGKLGRLLRRFWPVNSGMKLIWHGRSDDADIRFDITEARDALVAAGTDGDVIILLAGTTRPPFEVNAEIAKAVCSAAPDTPIIFASSAAVYGRGVCEETCMLEPVSDYGRAKLSAEHVVRDHGARHSILRIGNVVGADALLGVDRAERQLHIFENGFSPLRSYINPSLLAQVIETVASLIAQGEVPEIMNVATPQPVYMGDLLDAAGLSWTAQPAPPDAIASVVLDTSRIEALFAFPPDASSPKSLLSDWRR